MKRTHLILTLLLAGLWASDAVTAPLTMKQMYGERDVQYQRGEYLIVLPTAQLESLLGDFIAFKNTQGYDVNVVNLAEEGVTSGLDMRSFMHGYWLEHPMLEYVLLVGDVTGSFVIPSTHIQSINEPENDVTDYAYTFFTDDPADDSYDALTPHFLIGRISIQTPTDLIMALNKTIQYYTLENVVNSGVENYLNRALLVAGNYANNEGYEIPPYQWPVTPVWTSLWLMELLEDYGYAQVDTAFFHAGYQVPYNPLLFEAWNNGVGVVTYRGWGNSHGWHYPEFHIDYIDDLENGWKQPIVFSCVCNTGDFGSEEYGGPAHCFGDELLFAGSPGTPKGASAVVGPSDLDTDTRYNNVIFGAMWDALLDGEAYELGAALFAGKQALIDEFPHLCCDVEDVVAFYHHVYGVIGDPSLPVWLMEPVEMTVNLDENSDLHQSFIAAVIQDNDGQALKDVVGALIYEDELTAKGISNDLGELWIDFADVAPGGTLDLYLNKPQFYQKHIRLNFVEDDGTVFNPTPFVEFDVVPLLQSGESWLVSGESAQIALQIVNGSPFDYEDILVRVISDGSVNGLFYDEVFSIDAYQTIETGILVDGITAILPRGTRVDFEIEFLTYPNEQHAGDFSFSMIVGPIEDTDPVPPDDYGYWAYDNLDTAYPEAPVYSWEDISEIGTDLYLTDDSHASDVEIGFPFTYYGETYETMTVCSNGWASFEPCMIDYFWNFSIPMPLGPSAMLAPYFDDLDDNGKEPFEDLNGNYQWDDGEPYIDVNEDGQYNAGEPFRVYTWQDTENGRFIIQWHDLANGELDHLCDEGYCPRETFQLILYDPEMYPTRTGDGEIVFQYFEINDDDDENGNYSTVGIESPDQETGVQYVFNHLYAPGAVQLEQGVAVKYTTDGPQVCPQGDVNTDGSFDILDIVAMVSNILNGVPVFDEVQACSADVNEDGSVDILDIVLGVAIILG